MQDAILSPKDASTINGTIVCEPPSSCAYHFDGVMTIKVKNSLSSESKMNVDIDTMDGETTRKQSRLLKKWRPTQSLLPSSNPSRKHQPQKRQKISSSLRLENVVKNCLQREPSQTVVFVIP